MRLLPDTHLLLWASTGSDRFSRRAIERIEDEDAEVLFSAANIWEAAIKSGLGKPRFHFDAAILRRTLLENGYAEIAVTGVHASQVAILPQLHRDPFDRILIAQAAEKGATLLTVNRTIARYPGQIEYVG
jgi:PIN domain nuclease of toxin-antitoxin system